MYFCSVHRSRLTIPAPPADADDWQDDEADAEGNPKQGPDLLDGELGPHRNEHDAQKGADSPSSLPSTPLGYMLPHSAIPTPKGGLLAREAPSGAYLRRPWGPP